MNCPSCNHSNRPTAKFCDNCGHRFDPAAAEMAAKIPVPGKTRIKQTGKGSITQGKRNATATGRDTVAVSARNIKNLVINNPSPKPRKPNPLRTYLDLMVTRFGALPSFVRLADKGRDPRKEVKSPPLLSDVFVSLEVMRADDRVDAKGGRNPPKNRLSHDVHPFGTMDHDRRASVIRELADNPFLVVLGEPGSGKSTLLRHLCWAIAAGSADHLKDWPAKSRPKLPVFVNLRELAVGMPKEPLAKTAQASATERVNRIWACLEKSWQADNIPEMRKLLETKLGSPGAAKALCLFDGLDEVPPELRQEVSLCIHAWTKRWTGTRAVVTCRVRSYPDKAEWHLPFPDRTLQGFTLKEQVPLFIKRWFTGLNDTGWIDKAPENLTGKLLKEIYGRRELQELAPSPLLLTMMCLVHGRDLELPRGKALLYNRLVDLLLWEWEKHRESEAAENGNTGLADLLSQTAATNRHPATEANLKRAVADLVYRQFQIWATAGQRRAKEDELLLAETDLVDVLMPLHPGCESNRRAWAQQVVELIRQSSGLLMEVDDKHRFGFPHKTLAEFLCAFWLCEYQTEKAKAFATFSASLAAWDDWREVGLLAAGFMARNAKGDQVAPWLHSLIPEKVPAKESKPLDRIVIAAEMLLEVGEGDACGDALGTSCWDKSRQTLTRIAEKGWLPPPVRARAAACLGRMGDPRPGVGLTGGGLPDILWSGVIAAGPFPMGNDKKHGGDDDERPRHDCHAVTESFIISRHPVTVAQFGAFVKEGGYRDDRWWSTPAAKAWRKEQKITGPEDLPDIFETPNHPQVGISWFEAMAFCTWLSERTGRLIRLPSEAEWERAARHTDARTFPWGEDNPERHANIAGTGIRATSAAGIFPSGKAECGALDMAGNVLEWTRTPWMCDYQPGAYQPQEVGDGKAACVLRGGSFLDPSRSARCADRGWYHPVCRFGLVGFRVVSSPF